MVHKKVVIRTNVTITVIAAAVLSIMYAANYTAIAQALRTPIETTMSRMYTDNPANETLQMGYPRISQDSNGVDHILGEVVNKGNEPEYFVSIIATFYDSQNGIIGTKDTYTELTTIHPGQAAPFELIAGFGDTIPVEYIDHVKFHLDRAGNFTLTGQSIAGQQISVVPTNTG